jgi:hypothetical protein
MATSEILGLFASPEQYQANQMAQFRQRAANEVQLDPFQQAAIGMRQAGYQLGGGIAGALGGVDPQLQIIARRQALAGQLDPSNPQSYMQVAKLAADAGDQQFAIAIADAGRQAAVQVAQANKERQLAVPADIQKAQMIPVLQDKLDELNAMEKTPDVVRAINILQNQLKVLSGDKTGTTAAPLQVAARISAINQQLRTLDPNSIEYKDLVEEKTQLQRPEKPEPRISFGSEREAIASELYNQPYGELTQTQKAAVNKRADAEAASRAPKLSVDLKDPTAVAKAGLDVMNKWEGFLKAGGDVEVASRYKALQSSVALAQAGNPTADGATIFNIGKIYDPSGAVQEGDKNTILGNPSIPQKIKGYAQRVFEGGSLTPEQRNDLLTIGTNLIKGRESQLQTYRKQYINKATELGGTEADILNPYQGLVKATPSEAVKQIPTGRQQTPPAARTQPAPQGRVVRKWSDLNK